MITHINEALNATGVEIGGGADENKIFIIPTIGIIRKIPIRSAYDRWEGLSNFILSRSFIEFNEKNFIPKHEIIEIDNDFIYLLVETIPFVTRPWEWTRKQLLSTMDLLFKINSYLEDTDFLATDAHFTNFTFYNNRPLLLDIGSLSSAAESKRYAFESVYANINRYNIHGLNTVWYRMDNFWRDGIPYHIEINEHYDEYVDYEEAEKVGLILNEMGWVFNSLIDLGGGTGAFSDQFREHWKERIVIDICERALDRVNGSCAKIDLMQDIGISYNMTRSHRFTDEWYDRYVCEASLLSANIIHGTDNARFDKICRLCNIGTKFCIVKIEKTFIDDLCDRLKTSGWILVRKWHNQSSVWCFLTRRFI